MVGGARHRDVTGTARAVVGCGESTDMGDPPGVPAAHWWKRRRSMSVWPPRRRDSCARRRAALGSCVEPDVPSGRYRVRQAPWRSTESAPVLPRSPETPVQLPSFESQLLQFKPLLVPDRTTTGAKPDHGWAIACRRPVVTGADIARVSWRAHRAQAQRCDRITWCDERSVRRTSCIAARRLTRLRTRGDYPWRAGRRAAAVPPGEIT